MSAMFAIRALMERLVNFWQTLDCAGFALDFNPHPDGRNKRKKRAAPRVDAVGEWGGKTTKGTKNTNRKQDSAMVTREDADQASAWFGAFFQGFLRI
jgi:hypothetical protein